MTSNDQRLFSLVTMRPHVVAYQWPIRRVGSNHIVTRNSGAPTTYIADVSVAIPTQM